MPTRHPASPQLKKLPAKTARTPLQRAIALLARREHSAAELTAKLTGSDLTEQQAAQVVAQLAADGLQSDLRFAESFTRFRAEKWGRPRILHELARKGIDQETAAKGVDAVLGCTDQSDECSRALEVLRKRFASAADDPRQRQQQWRFLQARGFAADITAKALRSFAEQEKSHS